MTKSTEKVPEQLQNIQHECHKCWTYQEVSYPWIPERYGDSQVAISNDGSIVLRLKKLDQDFQKFQIMSSTIPQDTKYPEIDSRVIKFLSKVLKTQLTVTTAIGLELTNDQVSEVCKLEALYWGHQPGTGNKDIA